MKSIVFASLLALVFTTGFTCSKNQPAEQGTEQAAPVEVPAEAAPVEGAPADATAETTTTTAPAQ